MQKNKISKLIQKKQVLKLIQRIRNSFSNSVEVYTKGSCVKFAMILLEVYPKGQILYDSSHAIFELNGICYDIKGEAKKNKNHIPITKYGVLGAYDRMNLIHK